MESSDDSENGTDLSELLTKTEVTDPGSYQVNEMERMQRDAQEALKDSRLPKSIFGEVFCDVLNPDKNYVRIYPLNPEQDLDQANFNPNAIAGKETHSENLNKELKDKTEEFMEERLANDSQWSPLEAARAVKAERALAGEWWISLESYNSIHEHWAKTSANNPSYTLNDAFRDKQGLDAKWSKIGYDMTTLLRADGPIPCLRGMGNTYPRTGLHASTEIEQFFIPRFTAELLRKRGCYKPFTDLKKSTLDQVKKTPNH